MVSNGSKKCLKYYLLKLYFDKKHKKFEFKFSLLKNPFLLLLLLDDIMEIIYE